MYPTIVNTPHESLGDGRRTPGELSAGVSYAICNSTEELTLESFAFN